MILVKFEITKAFELASHKKERLSKKELRIKAWFLQSLSVENKAIIIGVMIKIAPSLAKNAERKKTKINKKNINFFVLI